MCYYARPVFFWGGECECFVLYSFQWKCPCEIPIFIAFSANMPRGDIFVLQFCQSPRPRAALELLDSKQGVRFGGLFCKLRLKDLTRETPCSWQTPPRAWTVRAFPFSCYRDHGLILSALSLVAERAWFCDMLITVKCARHCSDKHTHTPTHPTHPHAQPQMHRTHARHACPACTARQGHGTARHGTGPHGTATLHACLPKISQNSIKCINQETLWTSPPWFGEHIINVNTIRSWQMSTGRINIQKRNTF